MQDSHQKITALINQGKPALALKKLKTLARKMSNNAELERLLGVVHMQLNRLPLAEKHLNKARQMAPMNTAVWINLGSLHKLKKAFDEAENCLHKALSLSPDHVSAWFNLANVFRESEQWQQAADAYQQVIERQPNHLNALYTLGLMNKNLGNREQAIELLHQALNIDPFHQQSYLALANLKNYQFSDSESEMIEQITAGHEDHEVIELLFAQAQNLEHQQRYSEAFDVLQRANKAKYQSLNRTPFDWDAYTRSVMSVFNEAHKPSACQTETQPTPLFVVSLPRSGSTLVEQILASHSKVYGASELITLPGLIKSLEQQHDLPYPDMWSQCSPAHISQLAADYRAKIKGYGVEFQYVTDKSLINFNYIGSILEAMPDSRLIHCVRHPMDVCLSCYKQLFAAGQEYSYDLAELAAYHRHHEQIMAHWKTLYPEQILTVQYEDVVAATRQQVERMLAFLDLEWQEECLQFYQTKRMIKTASAAQVKQKINRQGVQRYQKYGKSLKELEKLLNYA
jgi:tetratricopeptide (TPR) repeat protein